MSVHITITITIEIGKDEPKPELVDRLNDKFMTDEVAEISFKGLRLTGNVAESRPGSISWTFDGKSVDQILVDGGEAK